MTPFPYASTKTFSPIHFTLGIFLYKIFHRLAKFFTLISLIQNVLRRNGNTCLNFYPIFFPALLLSQNFVLQVRRGLRK